MDSPAHAERRRWLRGTAPAAGTPRVVCCPHSGGSATYFRSWQRSAPPGMAVYAVQYPGRHERLAEPFAGSVGEMADELADELTREPPAPVVMFGHSMGAAVAFETARRLRSAGLPLAGLMVSSHTPPAVPVTSDIHTLPDDEMWRELSAFGGTEPEILELTDLREIYSPIVRADLRVSAEYLDPHCAGALDVPVVVLAGTRDAIAPPEHMRRWSEVTTGPCELRAYDGDHFHLQHHAADILRTADGLLSAGDRADTVLAWRRG